MNLNPSSPSEGHPTCGVVVRKQGGEEQEVVCGEPAVSMMSIVNPDDGVKILAIVLTCDRHEIDMQNGKVLIFTAEDGEHIAVQTKVEEKSNVS